MPQIPTPATGLSWGGAGVLYVYDGSTIVEVGPGGGGGVLLEDDFTGSNGSPWAAHWTTSGATDHINDIQGNQGRQYTGSLSGYAGHARALLDDYGESDFDYTADLIIDTNVEHYPAMSWRSDGSWASGSPVFPLNGYAAEVKVDFSTTGGWLRVERVDGGTRTLLQAFTGLTVVAGDTLHLNTLCVGTSVEVRYWRNADSKPSTPTYSFTDSIHTTRTRQGLGINAGAGSGYTIWWDNVALLAA